MTIGEINDGQGAFCNSSCLKEWKSVPARIWRYVNKTESCWLWTGGLSKGYGHCASHNGTKEAHRVVWELVVGPIPKGMELCHNCPGGDRPECVNPAHMFVGTRQDNVDDAIKKGRHVHGERVKNSKLKEQDVRTIRNLFGTMTQREIAKLFNIGEMTISSIKTGRIWKQIS